MAIHPILASLRAHRVPSLLVVAQIALACAVLCNAMSMIGQSMDDIRLTNAIDERGLSVVSLNGVDPKTAASDIPRDLAVLRDIPGVKEAATTSATPLNGQGLDWSFGTRPEATVNDTGDVDVEYYLLGEGADRAMGLHLIEGRFFNAEEYANSTLGPQLMPSAHVVIITASLAQRMWPGQTALGKILYSSPLWYTVVGVVGDVLCPDDGVRGKDGQGFYDSGFFPISPASALGFTGPSGSLDYYVLRSAPKDRDRIMRQAVARLRTLNPGALVKAQRYTDIRESYFADANSMVGMLVVVCAVMLAVTAFGIVGLTSFWVQQRRRQIGIRRALGASRGQILDYFRAENFLLTTAGVAIGMAMAFGVNLFLMKHYEMRLMHWYYLPCSAMVFWLLGQLAVLGPALRAAAVPPVVATRSV
ncbi:ABC transporter permease [Dyella jejuensis]|uniref:ABC transporter permease n=1 Tax=Dyella jejuensis TaxID=1432009 RepID=A0ABW8JKL6_9GAMM